MDLGALRFTDPILELYRPNVLSVFSRHGPIQVGTGKEENIMLFRQMRLVGRNKTIRGRGVPSATFLFFTIGIQ